MFGFLTPSIKSLIYCLLPLLITNNLSSTTVTVTTLVVSAIDVNQNRHLVNQNRHLRRRQTQTHTVGESTKNDPRGNYKDKKPNSMKSPESQYQNKDLDYIRKPSSPGKASLPPKNLKKNQRKYDDDNSMNGLNPAVAEDQNSHTFYRTVSSLERFPQFIKQNKAYSGCLAFKIIIIVIASLALAGFLNSLL